MAAMNRTDVVSRIAQNARGMEPKAATPMDIWEEDSRTNFTIEEAAARKDGRQLGILAGRLRDELDLWKMQAADAVASSNSPLAKEALSRIASIETLLERAERMLGQC